MTMRWYRIPDGYMTSAHSYTLIVEKRRTLRGEWTWEVKNSAGRLDFGTTVLFKTAKARAIAAAKERSR